MDNGAQMHLLGGDDRETFRQIEPHLIAENAAGARACPIALVCAVFQHVAHQVVILFHR